MVLPIRVFLTLQPMATFVDSTTAMPTMLASPATCATTDPTVQNTPTRGNIAYVRVERFFFMIQILMSGCHQRFDHRRLRRKVLYVLTKPICSAANAGIFLNEVAKGGALRAVQRRFVGRLCRAHLMRAAPVQRRRWPALPSGCAADAPYPGNSQRRFCRYPQSPRAGPHTSRSSS
jgi:hypothetical protein